MSNFNADVNKVHSIKRELLKNKNPDNEKAVG